MRASALVLALFASACATSRSGLPRTARDDAYHVATSPHAVRGHAPAALSEALAALIRELALPVVGDGRLAQLAGAFSQDVPSEGQLRERARVLGLVDGHLELLSLERPVDGSWKAVVSASLKDTLARTRPTHYGAFVLDGRHARIVLGRRPPVMRPVARRVRSRSPIVLSGRLPGDDRRPPVVELVGPDGRRQTLEAGRGPGFELRVATSGDGTYHLVVRPAQGRAVAVFDVDVGSSQPSRSARITRLAASAKTERYYRAAAQARRAQGLAALEIAPELERAATGAAFEGPLVLRASVVADSADRLLAALESDPACQSAVRHPDVTHLGIRVRSAPAGLRLSLVSARLSGSPASELTAASVLEGINLGRGHRGLAPLTPDSRLGEVARRTARAHLRGELKGEQAMVDAANLELERFSLAYRRVAAVVAIVSDPAEASTLESALDPGATAIGVGVARGPGKTAAQARSMAVVLTLGWGR